jgi:hypothetical protein
MSVVPCGTRNGIGRMIQPPCGWLTSRCPCGMQGRRKMCDEAAGTAALRAGRCTAYFRLFSLILAYSRGSPPLGAASRQKWFFWRDAREKETNRMGGTTRLRPGVRSLKFILPSPRLPPPPCGLWWTGRRTRGSKCLVETYLDVWILLGYVLPHPGPLPKERGETSAICSKFYALVPFFRYNQNGFYSAVQSRGGMGASRPTGALPFGFVRFRGPS